MSTLQLRSLSMHYSSKDKALTNVSLDIDAGEVIGLIGPSGAGKSTLIRCINRLTEPTTGEVLFKGQDLTKLNSRELRRSRREIAMIFQEYALIERLTVMENVLSGRLGYVPFWRSFLRKYQGDDIQTAYALLDRVGLLEHANKRADALSGGQRQRVGIARALAQQPELLLIDEPTAALDPRTARQVMRLICDICREQNLPAIINIHDVNLAKQFVGRIIGLRAGEVVFDGHPNELNESVLTQIYGEEDWNTQDEEQEEAIPEITMNMVGVPV
ncbi:phosphonate ABC transporter ATP-binding protein [Vibrio sp. 10N.286.49.C2]|uniref:phosphonate ABC transporter ATP-binding protein n=1 Tax=unclassified Vibrio TaxID=2614977 RepID=UPI000C8444A4|nr:MULTISPECIES: phosphonate ABC transporter ATP-binding protein [unclassified Vibrio]PMH37866.1 phosphonate ABC transporter ATP-binding protein [Vibrio sp. 10N.286.49.C2]PMH53202.1 phosphonate ABC transporter ATP-binding protein [Vibrio sp. 10N.286.49.B1]PMH83999.1 phosphonate ABC transporter ATP-binding protein [Vibrio sp. 10N.286.48.B7]